MRCSRWTLRSLSVASALEVGHDRGAPALLDHFEDLLRLRLLGRVLAAIHRIEVGGEEVALDLAEGVVDAFSGDQEVGQDPQDHESHGHKAGRDNALFLGHGGTLENFGPPEQGHSAGAPAVRASAGSRRGPRSGGRAACFPARVRSLAKSRPATMLFRFPSGEGTEDSSCPSRRPIAPLSSASR